MNPRVKKVKPDEDYGLRITFTNGEVRIFDVKPYLETGIFRELKNPEEFRAVRPFLGSVQWKGGQDLCPDTLYENSLPAAIQRPLVLRDKKSACRVEKPMRKTRAKRKTHA